VGDARVPAKLKGRKAKTFNTKEDKDTKDTKHTKALRAANLWRQRVRLAGARSAPFATGTMCASFGP
jgi:hypothetical protein